MELSTTRAPLFAPDWLVEYEYSEEELGILRPGKESEVVLIARTDGARTSWIAEKRFKARAHRGFKHDSAYWETGMAGSRREHRAMHNRTRKGREFITARWIGNEWSALEALAAAGITVPPPVELMDNGYRMAFIGDDGVAAPRLADVALSPAEAEALYGQMLEEVALMLDADRVHGDLSEFNVLIWRGRAVLIDFSQSVSVTTHPRALELLTRDVGAVCRFFRRRGVRDASEERAMAEVGATRARFARSLTVW